MHPVTIPGVGWSGRLLASFGFLLRGRLLFAVWLGWLIAWPRDDWKAQRTAADRLFIHPCLPCDGPVGTQAGLDVSHSTGLRIETEHMFHVVGQNLSVGILPGWQSTLSINKQESKNRNTLERSFSKPCLIHGQSVVTSPLALRIIVRFCFCFCRPIY